MGCGVPGADVMARVRMLMDVSGLREGTEDSLGVPWPPHGEILECGDEEAAHLVQAGIAEAVRAAPSRPAAPAGDAPAAKPGPAQARTAPRSTTQKPAS